MSHETWQEQLRRGSLDLAILLTVSPGPRYGLAIIQHLETFTDLVVTEGTIYPILVAPEPAFAAGNPGPESGHHHPPLPDTDSPKAPGPNILSESGWTGSYRLRHGGRSPRGR